MTWPRGSRRADAFGTTGGTPSHSRPAPRGYHVRLRVSRHLPGFQHLTPATKLLSEVPQHFLLPRQGTVPDDVPLL